MSDVAFLSTLPARGATCRPESHNAVVPISIHAPREGSDAGAIGPHEAGVDFYPRSPRGERRDGILAGRNRLVISIHAPREGSDLAAPVSDVMRDSISIHAPREGSDRAAAAFSLLLSIFLSPRPARGATAGDTALGSPLAISIHAPREGSDLPHRRG